MKVVKLHPHTQQFDASDPHVLKLVKQAGALGLPIESEFVWTLRNVGTDHVLLGSDYPQLPLGKTVAALERLDLTAEETSKILAGNARKLFGK